MYFHAGFVPPWEFVSLLQQKIFTLNRVYRGFTLLGCPCIFCPVNSPGILTLPTITVPAHMLPDDIEKRIKAVIEFTWQGMT